MHNKTTVPAATFKALFQEPIAWSFIYAPQRRCGVRRRCPPVITAVELIRGLVFHVVAEAGTLARHVTQLTGGYVQDRGPGAGGPGYPWARKVKGKTTCVALSKEQYDWLKEGIVQQASSAGNPTANATTQS